MTYLQHYWKMVDILLLIIFTMCLKIQFIQYEWIANSYRSLLIFQKFKNILLLSSPSVIWWKELLRFMFQLNNMSTWAKFMIKLWSIHINIIYDWFRWIWICWGYNFSCTCLLHRNVCLGWHCYISLQIWNNFKIPRKVFLKTMICTMLNGNQHTTFHLLISYSSLSTTTKYHPKTNKFSQMRTPNWVFPLFQLH